MLSFINPTRRRSSKSVSQAGATSALESRVLLAGNVSASLSAGGTLTINGDSNNNRIDVTDDGLGTIVVHEDALGTVNGSNDIEFNSADVKNIVIRGRAGNDDVRLLNLNLSGSLWANLGSGKDDFSVDNSHFGGKLTILGSLGDDHIDLRTTEVDGATYVNSDGGSDQVHFQDFLAHGKVVVFTGVGDDEVEVFNGASTFEQAVRIHTDGGSDYVRVGDGTTFDGAVTVNTGSNADRVEASLSTFNGNVSVSLGSGADEITVTGNTFNQAVTLDGGSNQDILFNDGTNTFAFTPVVRRIETIIV